MADDAAVNTLQKMLAVSKVLVLSKTNCPSCIKAKALLKDLQAQGVIIVDLDQRDDGMALLAAALSLTGQRTVPNIFIARKHIGGNDKMQELHRQGELVPMLENIGSL